MSVMRALPAEVAVDVPAREPRVRERAREAIVLMAFSAAVSVGLTLLLVLSSGVGR
jgi:hypothetical protein